MVYYTVYDCRAWWKMEERSDKSFWEHLVTSLSKYYIHFEKHIVVGPRTPLLHLCLLSRKSLYWRMQSSFPQSVNNGDHVGWQIFTIFSCGGIWRSSFDHSLPIVWLTQYNFSAIEVNVSRAHCMTFFSCHPTVPKNGWHRIFSSLVYIN